MKFNRTTVAGVRLKARLARLEPRFEPFYARLYVAGHRLAQRSPREVIETLRGLRDPRGEISPSLLLGLTLVLFQPLEKDQYRHVVHVLQQHVDDEHLPAEAAEAAVSAKTALDEFVESC